MRFSPRSRRLPVALAGIALLGLTAAPTAANPADDRFDQLDGPLAGFVVRPDAFGMDPSRTLVDPAPLLDRIDGDRAMAFVESLSFPRSATGPESARQAARDLVTRGFVDAGYEPWEQSVIHEPTGIDSPNILADLPGTECPSRILVVGAHHDSVEDGPGADDNATGVAGMLEVARALRDDPLPVTVRFVSWSYEEVGLVGSREMVRRARTDGDDIVGAIAYDMIGFTSDEIDPLTGMPHDYLAMIADPTSAQLARVFGAAAYHHLPEFPTAGAVIDPALLGDILRSDHASFIAEGIPGLLLTDTADFRNPNYHTVSDTPDTLDPAFFLQSMRTSLAGVVTLATSDQDGDGRSDLCHPPAVDPDDPNDPADPTEPDTPAPAPGATPQAGRPRYTG